MQTTIPRSAFPPSRLGLGLIGAADELNPRPRRASVTRFALLCALAVAATSALFALTACGTAGTVTIQRGPVQVGITSDGKTVTGNVRATEGKNVIELQRTWSGK